jgi:uncharacterized membrane protein YhaH (DUF805 family)
MNTPSTYPPGQNTPGRFPSASLTYLQGAPATFGEAIRQAFRNGFVYRGRASRSAYWWFALFQGIVLALGFVVFIPLAGGKGTNGGSGAGLAIAFIIGIPVLYLELAVLALTVRRLHDTDRSGSWLLIGLVPYVGGIVLLIFSLLKGTPGPNRYQP